VEILIEVFVIFLLTLCIGFLVMSEMALVTARKTKLQDESDKGNEAAKRALALSNRPTALISTVQFGITLLTIVVGAQGEAALSEHLREYLKVIPFLSLYSDIISFVVIISAITYVSLIFGELVPKKVALTYSEPIALFVSAPITFLMNVTSPFVTLLTRSTNFFVAMLGINTKKKEPISEDEIKVIIGQATSAGVLEKQEEEMVNKIFTLNDQRANDLMTPITEIVWLCAKDKPEMTIRKIQDSPHSHFPVYGENKEDILGILDIKEILEQVASRKRFDLAAVVHRPLYVLETTKVHDILEQYREKNTHLGLVVDEYGKVQGLITLNDIFEAIVGEIPDHEEVEEEEKDPSIIQRNENSWLVDGIVPLREFEEKFHVSNMEEDEEENIQTVGGFIMNTLDKVPTEGETVEWNDYTFEVVDMDGTRVDKIMVTKKV
jgi:putative hemolysin